MQDVTSTNEDSVMGLDVSDLRTHWCLLRPGQEEVWDRGSISTSREGLEELLGSRRRRRVVLEVGQHSPWMRDVIEDLGHEAVVANPRKLPQISRSQHKNDRKDAETLARLGRADRNLLHPIQHRRARTRCDLNVLRAREKVLATRTQLINLARGMAKSSGHRLPSCDASAFAARVREAGLPVELRASLSPVVDLVDGMTQTLKRYEKTLREIARTRYPEHELLEQIHGVGLLTSMTFLLVIDDPHRFRRSRDVGAYIGLVPRLQESGERRVLGHIGKGDPLLRRVLTQAAQYILGPFGQPSDLRRHGERIVERGGDRAKRRAVIAVARKLSVCLHHLWVTGEVYQPYRLEKAEAA